MKYHIRTLDRRFPLRGSFKSIFCLLIHFCLMTHFCLLKDTNYSACDCETSSIRLPPGIGEDSNELTAKRVKIHAALPLTAILEGRRIEDERSRTFGEQVKCNCKENALDGSEASKRCCDKVQHKPISTTTTNSVKRETVSLYLRATLFFVGGRYYSDAGRNRTSSKFTRVRLGVSVFPIKT